MRPRTSHAILAAATVAIFLAARNLAPSGKSIAGQGSSATAQANSSRILKPLPADPAEAIARLQAASLADCEAILAAHKLTDLPALVREALLLRLSELDPRRLARLLLEAPPWKFSSGEGWLKWLARAHRDILEEELAAMSSSPLLKRFAASAISMAESEERNDPRKTLESVLAGGRNPQCLLALGKLAESDPHLALDYLELLLKGGQLPVFYDAGFLTKAAEADPARFQALVGKVGTPEQSLAMASVLARTLAATDPAAAVAFYDSLPASRTRSIAALDLVSVWTRSDPEAALAWIQQRLPEGAVRRSALAIALAPFAATDPKRVLELLGPYGGRAGNDLSFNAYTTDYTNFSFGEGSSATHTNPDAIRERALFALVDSDPQAAFAILGQDLAANSSKVSYMPGGVQDLAGKALASWLGKDPAASVAWLAGLDDKSRASVLSGLSRSFQDVPPAQARQALGALDGFPDANDARNFMLALAPSLAKADAAAAFATADTLPERSRSDWTKAVIGEMAKSDPAAAAREVARLPEKDQAAMNGAIANQMARTAPGDAMAFLDGLPSTARKDVSYRNVFGTWVSSQPQAAVEWWQQLPGDSPLRNGTLPYAAGALYQDNPASAPQIIAMIAALPDESQRSDAVRNMAQIMAGSDREAAAALIANPALKLSEDQQRTARMVSGLESH